VRTTRPPREAPHGRPLDLAQLYGPVYGGGLGGPRASNLFSLSPLFSASLSLSRTQRPRRNSLSRRRNSPVPYNTRMLMALRWFQGGVLLRIEAPLSTQGPSRVIPCVIGAIGAFLEPFANCLQEYLAYKKTPTPLGPP